MTPQLQHIVCKILSPTHCGSSAGASFMDRKAWADEAFTPARYVSAKVSFRPVPGFRPEFAVLNSAPKLPRVIFEIFRTLRCLFFL